MSKKLKKKVKKPRFKKDDAELTLLALPTTVWYIVFCYLPIFGIVIAFKDFRVNGGFLNSLITSEWVGLKNFRFLFMTKDAFLIMRNTLAYGFIFVVIGTVVPLAAAIAIDQIHSKFAAKIYQTMMFLPHFLSWAVVSALVLAFLSFDKGLVNGILSSLGQTREQWYMKQSFWPLFLILLSTWKGLGNGMVVYLATLAGIDRTYYEVACIDGATVWQQIRYVTLPLMKRVLILLFIMRIGGIFSTDFGLFYLVPRDSNSLYNVVYTLDVYVYKQLKSATAGMSSAASLLQSVLRFATIMVTNEIVKKIDPESAMI